MKHELYSRWRGIIERCENPKHKSYKRYGGRGITICSSWRKSFKIFNKWAFSHGYKKELQLDRINNDGNYSPKNCRFVTPKENQRNKENTKLTYHNIISIKRLYLSKQYSQRGLAKKFDVSKTTIHKILHNLLWA